MRGCPRSGQEAAAVSGSRRSRGSRLRYDRGGGDRWVGARGVPLGWRGWEGREVAVQPCGVRGCAGHGADAVGAHWLGARRRLAHVSREWKGWAQLGPDGTSPPPAALPVWCWHLPHVFGRCFRAFSELSVSCGPALHCLAPSAPTSSCPHLLARSLHAP